MPGALGEAPVSMILAKSLGDALHELASKILRHIRHRQSLTFFSNVPDDVSIHDPIDDMRPRCTSA